MKHEWMKYCSCIKHLESLFKNAMIIFVIKEFIV